MKTALRGVLVLVLALFAAACSSEKSGGASSNLGDFPVNEAFAAELVAKGVPEDLARFVAAQRLAVLEAGPERHHFLQTFPNGATRDLTFEFGPGQTFVPSPEQLAVAAASGVGIYPVSHSSTEITAEPFELELQYFVPYSSMPPELVQQLATGGTGSGTQSAQQGLLEGDGAMIIFKESAKKGADVSIGSILEWVAEGTTKSAKWAGGLGALYAFASALSDIAGAMDLSKEHKARMQELDLLLKCAQNPTNPLAKSDPTYSATTAAGLESAALEVDIMTAVRFMNIMVDTSTGFHPGLALLKPGIVWNDLTLKDETDKEMQAARQSVTACDYAMTTTIKFSYKNSYEKCDSICHQFDQTSSLDATFPLTPAGFPGNFVYNGLPDGSSISMSDLMTFTHKDPLNPPYNISQTLTATGQPTVTAGGYTLPTGRVVEVTADATVPTVLKQTSMGVVNGSPTEQTTSSNVDVYMRVTCKFDNVLFTGGEFTGTVTEASPFNPNIPPPDGTPAHSCTLKLTPAAPQ